MILPPGNYRCAVCKDVAVAVKPFGVEDNASIGLLFLCKVCRIAAADGAFTVSLEIIMDNL